MRISRIVHASSLTRRSMTAAAMLAAAIFAAPEAGHAETAYISQLPAGSVTDVPVRNIMGSNQPNQIGFSSRNSSTGFTVPPEAAVVPHGGNIAQTLEIGRANSVFQYQSGAGNVSTAGVIGSYNNVAVLQGGNNLRSNVVLLNTIGMNVGVLQPAGSAPVNVLIARLPGGGLLIKR